MIFLKKFGTFEKKSYLCRVKTYEMDITPISKEAFAVLAECEETRKPFGITIDPKEIDLRFIWAFKIDRSKAQREGFAGKSVTGESHRDQ